MKDVFKRRLTTRFFKSNRLLSFIRYDIPRMFRNLWTFRKTIVGGYYWDSSFLYMAMRDAITAQREVLKNGNGTNAPKQVRDMAMALFIIDRLLDDQYDIRKFDFKDDGGGFLGWSIEVKPEIPLSREAIFKLEKSNKRHDLQLLAKLLAQNSPTWWN